VSAQSRSGGRATRRPELSQHFLRSGALASSLIEQCAVGRADRVIEIGPGRGALTAQLARCCRELVAVEIDPRLCDALRERFSRASNVSIVRADFLEWELPSEPYKLVANLPYARTTEIVRRLAGAEHPPDDAWLVAQREAARRFAGAPFAPETRLSLLLKPGWQIEIVRTFRRADFDPPPAVESVLLWMARRPRALVREARAWRRFVDVAFEGGGATVRQRLAPLLTAAQLSRLARELRFDVRARPATLGFDQWVGLFRFWLRERENAPTGRPGRSRSRKR
jgi:23S rRNA (adenine-N6)-dimethyltransferase